MRCFQQLADGRFTSPTFKPYGNTSPIIPWIKSITTTAISYTKSCTELYRTLSPLKHKPKTFLIACITSKNSKIDSNIFIAYWRLACTNRIILLQVLLVTYISGEIVKNIAV